MKAKEAAQWVQGLLEPENLEPDELCDLKVGSDLISRHILAEQGDPELSVAVEIEMLNDLSVQHKRYVLLLELVKADDREGRELLEHSLDIEIERRERRIIQ